MFELSGVSEPVAREAMRLAMHKLPMKCRFVRREVVTSDGCRDQGPGVREPAWVRRRRLVDELKKAKEELFNLRFQSATGRLDNHGRLRAVRKDISRIYTEMRERELRRPSCRRPSRRPPLPAR